jgi:hypothetical protein
VRVPRLRILLLTIPLSALLLAGSTITSTAMPSTAPPVPLRVRKDVKDLTPQEKADFVAAVLKLKQTPSPWNAKFSYYDQFVWWH